MAPIGLSPMVGRMLLVLLCVPHTASLVISGMSPNANAVSARAPASEMGLLSRFRGKVQPTTVSTPAEPPTSTAVETTPKSASVNMSPALDAVSDAFAPMMTIEDRGDGWDDVRAALRDRQKPWKEFKDSVNDMPPVRWGKVLVGEIQDLTAKS